MRALLTAQRRADEFAAAADGHTHVKLDPETERLLDFVNGLRALPTAEPDLQFASQLRSRLTAAAATELVAPPVVRSTSPRPRARSRIGRRLVPVAAATCIITASGMGVAAASQAALPGDALYPVKRGIEDFTVSIASSPLDRGNAYVSEATTRLREAQSLAITRTDDPGSGTLIVSTLTDFSTEAQSAATQLMTAYQQDSSPQTIADLRSFTTDSAQQLQSLSVSVQGMPQSPPPAFGKELAGAAQVVTRIDRTARQTCPTCSQLPPLTLPQVLQWFDGHVRTAHHGVASHSGHHGPSQTPAERPGKHEQATQQVPASGSGSSSPTQDGTPSPTLTTTTSTSPSPTETTAPTTPTASDTSPTATATTDTPPTTPPTTTAPTTTEPTPTATALTSDLGTLP